MSGETVIHPNDIARIEESIQEPEYRLDMIVACGYGSNMMSLVHI